MTEINDLLKRFELVAGNPFLSLERYLALGKKAIGCFPYYAPEELVHAAGMVPFGVWGDEGIVSGAREYFAPFYCSIAQMGLELGISGKLDGLSGVLMSSLCDTMRPLTQNFKSAVPHIPLIYFAHPQNRRLPAGIEFLKIQYGSVKRRLEEISGSEITQEHLSGSIRAYNASRAARREFVRLAGLHPEAVPPSGRCAVLKSAHFMLKNDHTAMLSRLNARLKALPVSQWHGSKIVTSGIAADSKSLLSIFEEFNMAVAADDVAQESRGLLVDAPEDAMPLASLASQFSAQDYDTLLYDPELNKRPAHIVKLVRESGADGVVILMQQFCDPEEIELPSLARALENEGIPFVKIDVDQQTRDYGQARTSLQAFSGLLESRRLYRI